MRAFFTSASFSTPYQGGHQFRHGIVLAPQVAPDHARGEMSAEQDDASAVQTGQLLRALPR